MRRNSDEHLRDLERRASVGDHEARVKLRRERRRRGLPDPAFRRAIDLERRVARAFPIYVPESWLAQFGPHEGGFEGTIDYSQTDWGNEIVYADLFQGEDEIYLRVERHLRVEFERQGADPDVSSDLYLYRDQIRDGARIELPELSYRRRVVAQARPAVLKIRRGE